MRQVNRNSIYSPSEPADLEFLQRVTELRDRLLEIIREQWRAGEICRLPAVVAFMRRSFCCPPFVLREIAAADPGESDDFVAFVVIERIDGADEFLIGGVAARLVENFDDLLVTAVRPAILVDRGGFRIEFPRLLDDVCKPLQGSCQHAPVSSYMQSDIGSSVSAFCFCAGFR